MRRAFGPALALALASCAESEERSSPKTHPDAGAEAGPTHREPDLSSMVEIPAGTFSMGHPVEPPGGYGQPWKENELPAHDVTLAAFHIDRDEVSVAEYADFLGEAGGATHFHPLQLIEPTGAGYASKSGSAKLPVAMVSWYDAAAFCAWSGKRLPTKAEWERAARGPSGSNYPWGEDGPSCERAVFFTGAVRCADSPRVVGGRSPQGDSAEGVRDLAGNVAEWAMDVSERYSSEPVTDPKGPATGKYRVVRGGGYHEAAASLRATARWAADPAKRSPGIGFRCAL